MTLKEKLDRLRNTRDYENLTSRLGNELAANVKAVISAADKADKELDIVHDALTELYNIDVAREIVQKALDKIEEV